ncbi:unnamed protein product [Periconia digitata]|uniref:C2H2-type domain-containing protein n=1 Tax=Periconia digitata TaxID=1303443 RepID=A0A9W4U4P8_9PLEO|nr:unnamed protein product [Periconia digitata]
MAMHLASMVHGSARDREGQYQTQHSQLQHANYYQPQPPQPKRQYSTPTSAPQHSQAQPHTLDYQYQRHPQSPPSPPVEDQKPSLPSISSLLHIADADKATSESGNQSPRSQQSSPQPQPQTHHQENLSQSFRSTGSPSAASNHSASGSYYLGQPLNSMEPHSQRQHAPIAQGVKRDTMPPQSMSPYNPPTYVQSPYSASPGASSVTSYYSPEPQSYPNLGMYSQRPLPSNFQPQTMPLPLPSPSANGSNPWQHHHYISASSQSAFPQSQDRYICSTCNKAFSRPSSLRIHSHSHTGEKPYKCPQPGCGKAFSVRSNMKRHERGCHASSGATMTA